jgi:hypothetical protein
MTMPPPSIPQPPKASELPSELPEVEQELTEGAEPVVEPSTIEDRHDAIDALQGRLLMPMPQSRAATGETESFNSVTEYLAELDYPEPDVPVPSPVEQAFNRALEALIKRPVIHETMSVRVVDGPTHFEREPFDTEAASELFTNLGHSMLLTHPGTVGRELVFS